MALASGTKLGPYEIQSALGAGGMGEVYRAHDTRLNRDVAVKVLPEHLAKDSEALALFEREAKAVAALAHPNLLVLYDVGFSGNIHYAVTELLEGETLRAKLSHGALPWRKAAELGSTIAEGLATAHSKGIVHRDVKPENIFLTADGRLKILDFGLAQIATPPSSGDETATLTSSGPSVMGTIGYMSPEQVRGEKAEAASDIFSLGCVLYEMVTGRRAFMGKSATDTMAAILRDEAPAVADSGKPSSPDLDRLIERCLAKNPAQRFHSARDLAFALRSLSSSQTVGQKPVASSAPIKYGWLAAITLLTLAALGTTFYYFHNQTKAIDSLAVLPFVDVGGGQDADWLGDGITESLIDSLFQVPGIKVMSRNTVFRYKGKETDAREVARQLGVRAVLTGRVVQRGNQLSVSAELVDARDGSVLWGEKYDRPMSDILAVQQDITARIWENLRLKLSGEDRARMGKRGTENPEAYQLYLKGKYFSGKFTKAGYDKGLEYLRQAIAIDPNYARAYEGMSYAYQIAADSLLPPRDVCPKSKEAAQRAIALDDSFSEGHTDLAGMYFWYDYDFPAARSEFARAIQLNPNSSPAHEYLGWFLVSLGEDTRGVAEGYKGVELDPLSVEAGAVLAIDLYLLRRYDEASDLLNKVLDQDPTYPLTYWALGMVDLERGQMQEAIAVLEKGREVAPLDWTSEVLAAAYARSGDREKAQNILDELDQRAKQGGYVPAYYLSYAYLALGDRNRALSALETDYEHRSPNMTYIKLDPFLEPLHNESRYKALVQKMKLNS